jgi:hypothetical protein
MVKYECDKCGKKFTQKGHYDTHNKRKTPCKKLSNIVVQPVPSIKLVETKPMAWYSENMPYIFNFVVQRLHPAIQAGNKKIIIHADVKTGKRFIAQAYSVYTTPTVGESYVHIFISSWVRRDDDKQRTELNAYFKGTKQDPRVFKINTEKARLQCIKKLRDIVNKHDKVIVHHDELDYGSGSEQHMAAVYEYCISQEKISLIAYSASYEEATIDGSIESHVIKFNPQSEYRGAKWFCDNNLVEEATPFFEINQEGGIIMSDSSKTIMRHAVNRLSSDIPSINRRKLVIIRMNTPFDKTKEMIDNNAFPELCGHDGIRILPHFIHSRKELNTMTVKWDSYTWWKRQMEIERGDGKFLLVLFIDQCSTRSTDWFCHPWLSVYHDYHPSETPINTCIQSNLRVVYYINKMCDGQKVYKDEEFYPMLYGQKDVIEYVAGMKTLSEIGNRPVSSRTKIFENINTFGKVIQTSLTNTQLEHPYIDQPLNDETRTYITNIILESLLSINDREKIERRMLKGKRKYNSQNIMGGIATVHRKKIHGLNSGPGGGIGQVEGDVYNRRGEYFWIDIAQDNLEITIDREQHIIPKGTVYITYGNADRPVDDDDDDSSVSSQSEYSHRVTKKSMYAIQNL